MAQDLTEEMPSLVEPLIHERDRFLSYQLRDMCRRLEKMHLGTLNSPQPEVRRVAPGGLVGSGWCEVASGMWGVAACKREGKIFGVGACN